MPRAPPVLTEEEKLTLQKQQEQELQCLQRQYYILEKDRQLFTGGLKLARLNKILGIYKKEHLNIEVDLEVAVGKKSEDAKDSDRLTKLLEDYDFLGESIGDERTYLIEMQGQIQIVQKDVTRLRSMQITDRQHEERTWAAMTTIDQLMNKLDVQNKKFGMTCAKNREMKLEVKRMLWERLMFMKIWDKLINKLVLGKKFMMDLIEQATIAYDQREEWCSKLQALRIKAHYDFVLHTNEMRELKRKQNNNKKLEAFFNIKGQKRIMKDLKEKKRLQAIEHQTLVKQRMQEFETHVQNIFEFAKETDVEVIAQTWCERESQNFGLFKRVNDLHEELEFLNDQLFDLRSEITIEQDLEDSREEHRRTTLEKLEAELEQVTNESQESQKNLEDMNIYINSMLKGIDELFKICKCNGDPIYQLLGHDDKSITVYNVMLYIQMIERAIHTALIAVYNNEKLEYEKKKITTAQRYVWDDTTKGEIRSWEKSHLSSPCPLCVGHELINDMVDVSQIPLSKGATKRILAERLKTSEYQEHVHNVSACFLPESREIIQRRYQ